ncbi:MAG: Ig-like domain-containing protein [Thermoanaerobaculia bacterium]
MWRRLVRGLALGCLCAFLVPAAYAQTFVGVLEHPLEGSTGSGVVLVRGFALDDSQISKVEVFVDDVFLHNASINIPRIDVIESYPNFAGVQTKIPGFQSGFLANRFTNGPHTVHVVVHTADGGAEVVGRRVIEIDNTINQSPFGFIDIPSPVLTHDATGSFPVVGWATDVDGIRELEVLVDGFVVQPAVYGDPRPDVAAVFPDFRGAMFSGFVANIDSTRFLDGLHQLTVRATDTLGLSRTIGQRTIQIFNAETVLRPFGFIDEPLKDSELFGTDCVVPPPCQVSPCVPVDFSRHITPVRGWALDLGTRENLGRVAYAELLLDGVSWLTTDDCTFDATLGGYVNCYGLPSLDVERFYPTHPDAVRSRFFFTLDVGSLMALGVRPGAHNLKVRVGDLEQTFAELPNSSGINVFFRCAPGDLDFPAIGYIEFPEKMDYVGGVVTFHGWALDSNNGVAVVNIYIDGNFMAPAAYGFARPDVQAVYPTFPGASNSGWSFTIDTNQLIDSRHRLTVEVIDSVGNEAFIGSVDFFVDNPD